MDVKRPIVDLEERVSFVHSTADKDVQGEYADVKTPGDLEGGALVAGGALSLMSREAMGLLSQYAAIGVVLNMLPSLSYPLFTAYLNMEGYQTSSYGVLVTIGYSYKVFFGMLSDCFPIFGYRRKPWMLIGWTTTMICLSILTFSSFGTPFCDREKTKYCGKALETVPASELKHFNLSAPDQGMFYIMVSMVASIAYIIAACASDAMVVEYAQREPEAIRGRVQTAIYVVRTISGIASSVTIGFGLNGPNYGGSFGFAISPNVPYGICLIPCVLAVIATLTLVVDKKTPGVPFREWCANFWELLQHRVMWQICLFRVVVSGLQSIGATPGSLISLYWAKVEPINNAVMDLASSAIFIATLSAVGKWGLAWNWRVMIAFGTLGVMIIDGPVLFLTIWDVVRNQWFYTGATLADTIPAGVRFIVSTYCAVEVADVGNEGATYGLITTIANLMGPIGSVVYKYIDSYFKVFANDIKRDSDEVRWDVSYVYFISYGCKIMSLFGLLLLPPQKKEMQELKRKGGKSKVAGALIIIGYFVCISFSMTSSIMAIYPSTKCYRIAGGNGKVDANGKCLKR
ncbi:hypothetical protein H257_18903 [Aphanomyces astaci]|uniref:Major facilitator superfamily (MFS) profile domain-containing protein n=1 Tax=Aphanomyces astaci TaxID=112090 RepID=W4FVQ4_APHAT|nr:hypothetical protein H257_13753 [Aphanomyces astaci]XP_009846344.1 hypothetical protein H257_18903 [Aphanomyces astaci]ETV64174.1 hypothetical protein H257_18903 [Aphanomyces astaci]ETV71036.1 hypothetical protein H257_13753 [Aphanomyces astaci]KAF0714723.1 hypothetical protein AaE_011504 [Aphanomyces astaci]RHY51381.1 hypothetical protein DYB38_012509 [Aphanomyces astaci]RHY76405.1 hypothetical protein DYB34_009694 [Aphanomyces astaci]|eukprot:XP_009839699.1 hypothetical protein H257_13753 [Aphanomyces astaci]